MREPLILQLGLSRSAAQARAEELLGLVRIPSPGQIMRAYPHELSGGMRQRVMIAIALSCGPKLLIADEPTTALDVTTQAQILELLRDLQHRLHMSVLLITHDLGVVAEFADDVLVMYAGRIVERSPVGALFDAPGHPLHRGPAALHAAAGGRGSGDAAGDRGHCREPVRHAVRLRLPPALPVCLG